MQEIRNIHPRNNWRPILKNCLRIAGVSAVELPLNNILADLPVYSSLKKIVLDRCSFPQRSLQLMFERYGKFLQTVWISDLEPKTLGTTLAHQILLKAAQCPNLKRISLLNMHVPGLELHDSLVKNIPNLTELTLDTLTGLRVVEILSESLQKLTLAALRDVTAVTVRAPKVPLCCLLSFF